MRKAWLDVPKIRYEQGVLTKVRPAEPRPPSMLVQVDVNHGNGLRIRRLQRFTEPGAADCRSRAGIVHVVPILHVMNSSGEQEERRGGQRRPALQKCDPLSREVVRFAQPLDQIVVECRG
jgi:hypothetical protein